MEVHLNSDLEKELNDVAAKAGRDADELAQEAIAGYLGELTRTRTLLDGRYDDLKSGRVTPVDGETFFESLRGREEELIKRSGQ
jgi:hypothetical protein